MSLLVPYETSGQELGETRQAMTKRLMQDLEEIIAQCKDRKGKYYVLIHAKPWPKHPNIISIKKIVLENKPRMLLSCLLFGIDNATGTLTLEWALPGDWPTWAVGGSNEPIPETIASIEEAGIHYYYDNFLPD